MALRGKEWHTQDIHQATLVDPIFGDVWDLNNDRPLTHPNCRCNLEVDINYILDKIPGFARLRRLLHRIDC